MQYNYDYKSEIVQTTDICPTAQKMELQKQKTI